VKSAVVAKDLRGNDPEELRRAVRKLEEELFKHKLKKNTNQLENTMLIRNTKRDIARVNTVLSERLRAGDSAVPSSEGAAKPDAEEAPKKSTTKPAAKARKPAAKAASAKET